MKRLLSDPDIVHEVYLDHKDVKQALLEYLRQFHPDAPPVPFINYGRDAQGLIEVQITWSEKRDARPN